MKQFHKVFVGALVAILGVGSTSQAAVTIAYVSSSTTGGFTLSDKTTLPTTGEISIGYFTGTAPTATDWQNILQGNVSDAWNSILNLGYKDVRAITGATLASGFDPSFATKGSTQGSTVPATDIGASVQNIPFATLAARHPARLDRRPFFL